MIELPRAALRAAEIAEAADFFSFGTNDLTQTTLGVSRDDAGKFLPTYVDAGVFDAGEVQLCAAVARLVPGATDDALLGLAVAARGPRLGHVCIELDDVDRLVIDRAGEAGALSWPDVDRWTSALRAAPFVSIAGGSDDQRDHQGPSRPLVWDGRLYLQRMHRAEVAVADELRRRGIDDTTTGDGNADHEGEGSPGLESILDDLFGPAPVDDKLLAWQDENQWFGKNRRMTSYALGLHEDLLEEGIPAGSDEYYRRINADVKDRFPDEFGAGGSVDAKSQRTKSNIVAPATRSTAPRKIVLTQTQVNLAKRFGLTLEQYAREVAKEMRK
jgi:hypothetical protein